MLKDKLKKEERLRHLSDLLPAGFDAHQAMRVLAEYVRTLEVTFEDLKKTAAADRRRLESDFRNLQKSQDDQKQEVDRLTGDLLEVTNTLEEQDSLVATLNQKLAAYEKQNKKLHRENTELANKLTQRENDARFFRQELDRSRKESESLNAALHNSALKLEELERKVTAEREAAAQYDKEVRRLNMMLSESQDKIGLAEKRMKATVQKYNKEIKRLSERAEFDAQHEASVLRKRIKSLLAPEMMDLEKLLNHKLNRETANQMKALLIRFVHKLEQAGLELT